MKRRKFKFHNGQGGAALAIRVTPRARRNEVAEVMEDGTIRIRLTAPPVEGKANRELIKFLSKILDVPSSYISIVAGETGRDKLVSVLNIPPAEVQRRILNHLS